MKEIKVNIKALEDAITSLQNLKTKCADFDTKSPASVGGGASVTELDSIVAVYKKINTHFADLVGNTASFMNNVKDSYISSDQKASKGIGGK